MYCTCVNLALVCYLFLDPVSMTLVRFVISSFNQYTCISQSFSNVYIKLPIPACIEDQFYSN